MMKSRYSVILLLMMSFMVHGAQIKNNAKPLKGSWDFKPKKLWMLDNPGTDVFGAVESIDISDDGTVYVADSKNYKVFVISGDGKYLSSIGNRGSGPGEFSVLRHLAFQDNRLIVVDDINIHYFSKDGKHLKSVINQYLNLTPVDFVNPEKFISVTLFTGSYSEKGQVLIVDIPTKTRNLITEFPKFKPGAIPIKSGKDTTTTYSFSVSSLTPRMILGYRNNRLYFGMNDRYTIRITDLNGKAISQFSVDRKREKVTDKFKEELILALMPPTQIRKEVYKRLPNYLNYFNGIYVNENGYIYVFLPSCDKNNIQNFDIFSGNGTYLYSAQMKVEPGYGIKKISISGAYMYLILENEEGDIFLAKYAVVNPK
ncbi:MAG: 6-bladed beta-propeller [Candidatus Omnitrophota bacterium]